MRTGRESNVEVIETIDTDAVPPAIEEVPVPERETVDA